MKRIHLVIIALLSVCTLTAAVVNVPEDAATIQAGIDVANTGDIVLVGPGTYVENINFNGESITVKSSYGSEFTIIDGNQNGSVVLFLSGEDEDAVLDGFTITNGTGWDNGDEIVGGGIVCRFGSSPNLKNLIVTENSAIGGADPGGGGITIAANSNPTLENVEISHNESAWGGGLAIAIDSDPSLINVEIHHNDATTTGGGAYIGERAAPYFEDVYVHDNHAVYYGGGIFLHDHTTPTFNKITVRANRSPSGGGGMITNDGSKPAILNSIFWGNIPDQILFNNDTEYLPDTVMIAYSNIQGGEAGIDIGPGVLNWEEENVALDPCFIGEGDGLRSDSPCIDSGTDFFSFDGVTLLDMDQDEYAGNDPEMGSWEAPTVYQVPGNFSTIQGAIDATIDGDIIMVEVGTYVENINFKGKGITVKSMAGPEYTIIDGNETGPGVVMTSGESNKAVLDGFTITNGTGWYSEIMTDYLGGGLCVRFGSSPILRNLIITDNHTDFGTGAGPAGGGVAIGGYSHATLENVIISDNSSQWGGGLSISAQSNPIIRNVEINNNSAVTGGGGGGVYIGLYSEPYFEDVFIHDNNAPAAGGFFIHDHARPILNKITVRGNNGPNGGGGMVTNHGSKAKIVNSIFYGNLPDQIYLMYYDSEAGNLPDTVSIAYSNVIGGVAGMHLGIGHVDWITGNLQENPRFGTGDRLMPISNCIDAGIASYSFEGNPWIDMSADEYIGSAPDMGSYEVPAPPQVLLVPQNFSTIQLAIDAAQDGDSILVAAGTYVENINYLGKDIIVKAVSDLPEATIIDGGGLNSTVSMMSGEQTAVLDGFTITNGQGWVNSDGYSVGGGIVVRYGSTPTLRNLIVEENNSGSSAVLDTSMGGGIMCAYGADAIIEDVIIRNNSADYGGGIVAYESSPTLRRVKISGNEGRVTGGGLTLWTSDALIEQVVIYKNVVDYIGAGVWVHMGGNPTLDRVTVVDNKTMLSADVGAKGAGIALSDGATLTLKSSIVWFNKLRGITSNNIEFYHLEAPNTITVMYSDIQGGEAGIITHDNGTVNYPTNNIPDDPMFVDRGVYNYNLQTGSPCIGTGMLGVDMGAGGECMTLATDPPLAVIPEQFALYQNYPNPFNPATSIRFELPDAGWVKLVIYDVTGREVATLIDDQRLGGEHSINWFAQDKWGEPLSTGIYLYKMKFTGTQGKQFREVRKLMLLK